MRHPMPISVPSRSWARSLDGTPPRGLDVRRPLHSQRTLQTAKPKKPTCIETLNKAVAVSGQAQAAVQAWHAPGTHERNATRSAAEALAAALQEGRAHQVRRVVGLATRAHNRWGRTVVRRRAELGDSSRVHQGMHSGQVGMWQAQVAHQERPPQPGTCSPWGRAGRVLSSSSSKLPGWCSSGCPSATLRHDAAAHGTQPLQPRTNPRPASHCGRIRSEVSPARRYRAPRGTGPCGDCLPDTSPSNVMCTTRAQRRTKSTRWTLRRRPRCWPSSRRRSAPRTGP